MKRQVKAVSEAKKAIREALGRMPMIKGHGAPFIPAEVREASGLPKALFDKAAVELLREGRIYMAEHDHAGRLRPEERDELVADGRGVFYCSLSDRRPARPLPAEAIPAC